MVRLTNHQPSSDSDLTTRIGIAFATRPRIAWHEIQVTVHDGIVSLRGEVPSAYDRHLVVAITRHVAGVFGIDDQIQVVEPAAQVAASEAKCQQSESKSSQEVVSPRGKGLRATHFLRVATFALALIALIGCGKSEEERVTVHPVSGAIKFRGQPISGAFVSLHPKDGTATTAPNPRATVGTDGKFALSTYDGNDGAPEGEYVLTVQWYKPIQQNGEFVGGPNVLPKKYALAQTSDLRIKIAAGQNELQPIQLR